MQATGTGRMAGQAGPSVYQAVAALLVATTLVVGLALAAQRISIGGPVAAPAPDAKAIQQFQNDFFKGEREADVSWAAPAASERYLIDHRRWERDLGAGPGAYAFPGTWTSGDLADALGNGAADDSTPDAIRRGGFSGHR
jgi:hypothetical protein